jgi:hypothetical protein
MAGIEGNEIMHRISDSSRLRHEITKGYEPANENSWQLKIKFYRVSKTVDAKVV